MNAQADDDAGVAALAEARRRGAARLAQWQDALPEPFSPAALEFGKASLGEGEIRCETDVNYTRKARLWVGLRFCCLAVVAWFGVLLALCRFPSSGGRIPGTRVVAVHGEVSNRTRHLLEGLKAGEPTDAVLVLGLPRRSLAEIRKAWSPWLGASGLELRRPVSLGAFASSMPAGCRAVAEAYRLARSCPCSPRSRELAAILARLWLGEAHALWWSRHGGCVALAIYGHTGTADTSRLEQAQQANGATTVHLVHGISGGRNFLGLSDVAVWRCGHDADWHTRLGGYGSCSWVPAKKPRWRCGESGILLLTSLAHPMNIGYRLRGIEDELALLRSTVEAVRRIGVDGVLTWRPHPAIKKLPLRERESLRCAAESLEFRIDFESNLAAMARRARWVISSESTVVVELLAEGVLPIMWPSTWSQRGSALSEYPAVATSAEELSKMLLEQNDQWAKLFDLAWTIVRPGQPSRFDCKVSEAGPGAMRGGLQID